MDKVDEYENITSADNMQLRLFLLRIEVALYF